MIGDIIHEFKTYLIFNLLYKYYIKPRDLKQIHNPSSLLLGVTDPTLLHVPSIFHSEVHMPVQSTGTTLHMYINNSMVRSYEILSHHCTETLYKLLFVFPEPFLTLGGVFCTIESVSLFSIFLSCFFFILLIFAVFLI